MRERSNYKTDIRGSGMFVGVVVVKRAFLPSALLEHTNRRSDYNERGHELTSPRELQSTWLAGCPDFAVSHHRARRIQKLSRHTG